MRRRLLCSAGLMLALGLFLRVEPAGAYIMTELPLKRVLQQTQFIFTVKIETFDLEKRLAVVTVEENLKGKLPFQKMHFPLPEDKEGAREYNKPSHLIKRLAAKQTLIFFADLKQEGAFGGVRPRGNLLLMLYTNGTWAQFNGDITGNEPPQASLPVKFWHFEPYLRRTFAGPTDELRQIIIDGLAGKKEPPPYNPKVEPGFGPEAPNK